MVKECTQGSRCWAEAAEQMTRQYYDLSLVKPWRNSLASSSVEAVRIS